MENAPKTYLYHIKPEKVEPNEEGREVLYPLYVLKDKFPKLYDEVIRTILATEQGFQKQSSLRLRILNGEMSCSLAQ